MNAATVTNKVKKHMRLAGVSGLRVNTRFTRLREATSNGQTFAWQTVIHTDDPDVREALIILLDNLEGLVKITNHRSFLSVITENR